MYVVYIRGVTNHDNAVRVSRKTLLLENGVFVGVVFRDLLGFEK